MIKTSWPEIPEARAEGETARLYEDIRTVTGLPLVNLIYRHIATIPGGLDWTWGALRPLYESTAAAAVGRSLSRNAHLPDLPQLPEACLTAAGLHSGDIEEITVILDFYIRGNAMNLLAMLALCKAVDQGTDRSAAAPRHASGPGPQQQGRTIRPILQMDALNENTRLLVVHLNKIGEGSMPDSVNASLFRHLAYWPMFLCLADVYLLPLDAKGTIVEAAKNIRTTATAEVAARANGLTPERTAGLDGAAIADIRTAAGHFTDLTIPRLLAICLILRRALPGSSSDSALFDALRHGGK
jgi:hypothetical protein